MTPAAPAKDPLKNVAPVKCADEPKKDAERTDVPAGDDDKAINEAAAAPAGDAPPPAADPAAADPMAAAATEPAAAQPPVAPPAPPIDPMTRMEQKLDQVLAILTKLIEAPVTDTPGQPAPVDGTPSTAFADPSVKALEAAVGAVQARLDAQDKATATQKAIAATRTRLAPFAHAIPDLDATLATLHASGGEPALAKFAEVIARTVRRDPTASTLDGEEGETVVLPDALAKFASRGPDEIAQVSRLARDYEARGPAFARTMSLERFVDLHLHLKSLGK